MVSSTFIKFSSKLEEIKTLFGLLTAIEKIDGLKHLTSTLNFLQLLNYGTDHGGIPELVVHDGSERNNVHFMDTPVSDILVADSLDSCTVQNGSSCQGQKVSVKLKDTHGTFDFPAEKSEGSSPECSSTICYSAQAKQKVSTRKRKQTEPRRASEKSLVSKNKFKEAVTDFSGTRKSSRLQNSKISTFNRDESEDSLDDFDKNSAKPEMGQPKTYVSKLTTNSDNKKVKELKTCATKKYQISRKLLRKAFKSKGSKFVDSRKVKSHSNFCSKCGKHFPSLDLYLQHTILHGDAPMSCLSCHQVCLNRTQMDRHKCKKSTQRLRFAKVGKNGDSKFQKHSNYSWNVIRWSTHPKNHTCQYCGKVFRSKGFLYSHYKHHARGRHICQACGQFFSTTTEYRQHIQTHQGESAFLCLRCGMKYNAGEYYDKHYRHHKTCDCNLCTFTCDDQQELRGHILTDHNITWDGQPLSYKCEECGEKFSRRSLLEIHNKQHMDCKPIECQPCQLYFTSKKSLDIHKMSYRHSLKTGEAMNDEKKYLCSVCGKTYFRKHALQRHMLLHTGKKPHKCEHCNFRSYEVNNLKRHMALHFEAERNFVCEMCGAAFHARKTLEMHHTYKHNDVRAFACNMCDKTFKAKNTLVRHMKVHSSDKEHRCWCGTAFKRMYNLRRHLQTVHDNHDSHILPPVKRVKTLDTASKAPVSRTDHVQGFTARNKSRRVTNKKTNNECTRNVNKSTLDASHSINNFPNAVPHANLGYLAQKVHDSEIQEPVKQDFFTPILSSVTEQGKANLGLSTPTPLVTHDHMYYDHHVPNIPITTPPIQSNNISHPPTLPMGNSNTMSPLPAADTTLRTRFPSVESLYSNIPYPSSLDNGDSISIQGGSAISSGSHILKQLLNLY